MVIQRTDPLQELIALQERMNSLFQDVLSGNAGPAGAEQTAGTDWMPPADLYEEAEKYVVRADLPGIAAGDIRIQVDDNHLNLTGERRMEPGIPSESYLRIERRYGMFSLQVALPPSVDRENIRANHKNGVLEVLLPKKKEQTGGKIEIEVD